jgi:hypothetical protein
MDIINRDGKDYTRFKVESFSIQGELFKSKCELVLRPTDRSIETNDFFWSWMQKQDNRSIMIVHEKKQYILKTCVPMYVFSDNKGYVTNTKLKVEEVCEITRQMKIEDILK